MKILSLFTQLFQTCMTLFNFWNTKDVFTIIADVNSIDIPWMKHSSQLVFLGELSVYGYVQRHTD